MPQWASLLIGALLAILTGAASSVFSNYLGLKKSYAEKWWMMKCEAYSRITEALHHAANSHEEWSDEELSFGEWEFSESKKKQLAEDNLNATRELSTATGVGAYIISDEVAEALADLKIRQRDIEKQYRASSEPRFEAYAEEAKAHRETLQKVRQLAKADLGIR